MSTCALTVLMPVYNEVATIERAVEAVLAAQLDDFELIVVDDGSTDGTRQLLEGQSWDDRVRLVFHNRNRGKGAALCTALADARGEYATVMDADLEYDAADIPVLLEALHRAQPTAVFGARGFQAHSAYSFPYVVGGRAVTLLANLIYNGWISDMMTGQKAMRTDIFRSLRLRERGFAIEAEITARLLGSGGRIDEVPVMYRRRSRDEGKKLTALDGLRVVRTLLRCRFA